MLDLSQAHTPVGQLVEQPSSPEAWQQYQLSEAAFRDGVQSAADEPLLEGVPPIPKGSRMEGQFFPLLFTPA